MTNLINATAICHDLLKPMGFLPMYACQQGPIVENDLTSDQSSESVIFLVDDWKEFTDLMSSLLDHGLGVKTLAFNTPESALEALEHTKPKLIVSDLLMPNMNGFEFLREVARREPGIPSILVTGSPPDADTVAANVPEGFLGMLAKPISWRDISEMMQEHRVAV